MAQDVYLVEIVAYDPSIPGTTTLRYSTGLGHVTGPSETPANTFYDPRVLQPLKIERTMFAPRTTRGRSTVGIGDIVLANDDGDLDGLINYGFDGRTVTVRRGAVDAAYPGGFPVYFEGTMSGVEVVEDRVFVRVRDWQLATDVPLQTTKYTGGGLGTLEGTSDSLEGKPKPVCYGVVKNIQPPCVETAKLIYQVSDAQVASIDKVYDRGVELAVKRAALFVVAGAGGSLFTSTDGITWTSRTSSFGTSAIKIVRYGRGVWIAAGVDSKLARSTDAVTWTQVTHPFVGTIYGLATDGEGTWIACGDSSTSTDGVVMRSTDDGQTWTMLGALPFAVTITAWKPFFSQGVFILPMPNDNAIAYSVDGLNWTQQTVTGSWYHGAYGAGLFVLTGMNSTPVLAIRTSPPANLTWTTRTPPASHTGAYPYYGATFGNSLFVICGGDTSNSIIATSPDGITWTARTAANTGQQNDVAYSSGIGLYAIAGEVVGASRLQTSPDGTTWTDRAPGGTGLATVAAGFGGSAEEYANTTDLLDNSLAPPAGSFKACRVAGGSYFRLGATPDGEVTADATQGAAAANRTTAQIWATILDERAGMATGDWSASDVTSLDTANNDEIGFWTDQEVRVSTVLDLVAGSAGAAWFLDLSGVFRIKQFVAPSGSPVVSFTANDLIKPLERVTPNEIGRGVPQYRQVLRYQRNYTVQTSDIAPIVTDARRAFLAKEWREEVSTDATVQTTHLLAPEAIEETLLDVTADAAAEASRRQTLRGVLRDMFDLVVPLNDDTDGIELNDVIKLTHSRYGLSAGVSFRVIGIGVDVEDRELTLTVWG